jgi:hypothetical protein
MTSRWKSPRRLARILALPALVAGILIPSAVSGTIGAHHQAAHRAALVTYEAPAPMSAMRVTASARLTSQRAALARAQAQARAVARAEREHEAVLLAARQRVMRAARAHVAAVAAIPARAVTPAVSGEVYSYAGIEGLWLAAGGNPAYASTAACIAEHESGGRIGAVSATQDFGVFQEHDDPAALNPQVSAVTAVRMSGDGTNWSAWTTSGYC